jgi:hypothetical protein
VLVLKTNTEDFISRARTKRLCEIVIYSLRVEKICETAHHQKPAMDDTNETVSEVNASKEPNEDNLQQFPTKPDLHSMQWLNRSLL